MRKKAVLLFFAAIQIGIIALLVEDFYFDAKYFFYFLPVWLLYMAGATVIFNKTIARIKKWKKAITTIAETVSN